MRHLNLMCKISIFYTGTLIFSACSENIQKPENQSLSPPVSYSQVQETSQGLGRRVFTRCRACHTLNEGGRHKVGPNLWEIMGRKAGSSNGYAYSKTMTDSEIIWTEETISAYLENPARFLPRSKMSFSGLRKKTDRDAIIAYLKANTGAK